MEHDLIPEDKLPAHLAESCKAIPVPAIFRLTKLCRVALAHQLDSLGPAFPEHNRAHHKVEALWRLGCIPGRPEVFQQNLNISASSVWFLQEVQRLSSQERETLEIIAVEHLHFLKLLGLEADKLHPRVEPGHRRIARGERVLTDVVKHGFSYAHAAVESAEGKPAAGYATPVLVQELRLAIEAWLNHTAHNSARRDHALPARANLRVAPLPAAAALDYIHAGSFWKLLNRKRRPLSRWSLHRLRWRRCNRGCCRSVFLAFPLSHARNRS